MERDVEGQARVFPVEKPGKQDEVRCAADGQKFRDALYDGQNEDLNQGHWLVLNLQDDGQNERMAGGLFFDIPLEVRADIKSPAAGS